MKVRKVWTYTYGTGWKFR